MIQKYTKKMIHKNDTKKYTKNTITKKQKHTNKKKVNYFASSDPLPEDKHMFYYSCI